jgi:hypothetical protein
LGNPWIPKWVLLLTLLEAQVRVGQLRMTSAETTIRPLPAEKNIYMQRTAAQAILFLQRFSDAQVGYDPVSLQVLDEWIDRLASRGPLPTTARAMIIAHLGQTFIQVHGGAWATRIRGDMQSLGVVCPVVGPGRRARFIDISAQVNERLTDGIRASLAFFYLTASVDLQGRS